MLLTRDQARGMDQRAIAELGIPGVVLMENAGRNIAELLRALGVQGRVVVGCGPGNNGGDGFVIARHLANAGIDVRVLLFAKPGELRGAAAVNLAILQNGGHSIEIMAGALDEVRLRSELALADWAIDALFGSGLKGPLRAPFDCVVTAINEGAAKVLAVDIPSGLDADTGRPLGPTVRAHHTATIVAPKRGFLEEEAQPWLGKVHVIDMGMPRLPTNS